MNRCVICKRALYAGTWRIVDSGHQRVAIHGRCAGHLLASVKAHKPALTASATPAEHHHRLLRVIAASARLDAARTRP